MTTSSLSLGSSTISRQDDGIALGVALHAEGRLEDALAVFGPLQAAHPTDAGLNARLGTVLAQLGRFQEGLPFLKQAARLQPDNPDTLNNLGLALQGSGDREGAAEVWNDLGCLFYRRKAYEQAQALFERALELAPDHIGAGTNLGATLQAQGRHQEAIAKLSALLKHRPDEAAAHTNLANAHMGAGDLDLAIEGYNRAIALNADHVEAYSNLGLALSRRGPVLEGDSVHAEQQSLSMAGALVNLGNARHSLGADPSVLHCYERALALRPDFPAGHWNLALFLLQHGDYENGWREYEWRWKWPGFGEETRPFRQPVWRGEPPTPGAAPLLVTAEQGFGDTMQFVRYLPLLVERGFDVVFEAQSRLFTLLWYSLGPMGVRVVPRTSSPATVHEDLDFSAHAPLLSLPERFGTRVETIPAAGPYLFAEPQRAALWLERLSIVSRAPKRVGLVWRGRPEHARDRERSLSAQMLSPLLEVPGIQFFSLHVGPDAHDVPPGVMPLANLQHDFAETAAIIANLDLVITVDTSVAHLAGAMGVPTWIMLAYSPDWRWLLDRDDSPWYPSVTLFRQPRFGAWGPVIEEVRQKLAGLFGGPC